MYGRKLENRIEEKLKLHSKYERALDAINLVNEIMGIETHRTKKT